MLDRWFKKEKPLQGLAGMGGGNANKVALGGSTPITASGGTESTPGDGFKYHVFEYNSPGPFNVTDGAGEVQIMLQGGGGGGTNGVGPSNPVGGPGGGGGGTGVFTISKLGPGNHTFSVGGPGPGNGGAGGNTTFTPSDSAGTLTANGANGNTGGPVANSLPGATTTGSHPGSPGSSASPQPYSPGADGSPAGGIPQPGSNWWHPYITPGAGGTKSFHTPAAPVSYAVNGGAYGGGGGGGKGRWPMPNGNSANTPGANGGSGRAVVRYLVP